MKRRFIIGVSGLNKEDQDKFVEFLRQNGMGWWHWIGDFWLLTARKEEISASMIRDFLNEQNSPRRCIVFEVDEDKTWAGFGPNKAPQDMFDWIKNSWRGD